MSLPNIKSNYFAKTQFLALIIRRDWSAGALAILSDYTWWFIKILQYWWLWLRVLMMMMAVVKVTILHWHFDSFPFCFLHSSLQWWEIQPLFIALVVQICCTGMHSVALYCTCCTNSAIMLHGFTLFCIKLYHAALCRAMWLSVALCCTMMNCIALCVILIRVAKCHRYGRYIREKTLEGLGRRPRSCFKWSSFGVILLKTKY